MNKAPVMCLEAFTGEIQPDTSPVKGLSDYEFLRVTSEKNYPNNEPVITWDGSGIAAPANLTAISAQAKAGKTAFITMLLAGAISVDGEADTFSRIAVQPNIDKKSVIVFDTEQAESDQQYNVRTTLKRANLCSTPDYFLSYNIRQLHIEEFREVTDGICGAACNEFGGIHSIFVDGVADYISDVNSIEQATAIREYFTLLAIKYTCPVILVIHQNPGSTKERGHLGSEIQRKCYGIINITKDGNISTAKNTFSRKAGELEPISFAYSHDYGYHTEIDAPVKTTTSEKKLNEIQQVIKKVFAPPSALRHNEAVKEIMKVAQVTSDRTAKNYLNFGEANDWITCKDGFYRSGVKWGNSG